MGCGGSKVPAVIIPDPESGKEHKFLCKKKGMMSSDFEVFKDFDEHQKWLFIDKKGSLFKDPKYMLENYVRDEKKQGHVICSAKVGDANVKIYGVESHDDSDDSDGYSDSGDDGVEKDTVVTKMKWAQTLKVKFFNDRAQEHKIAEMKVKAKGKAKKKETTYTATDEEGNTSSSTKVDIQKKVKKMIYKIEFEQSEGGAKYEVHINGKLNGKESELQWKSDLFDAKTKGWINQKVQLTTNAKDPGFALLCGFLCAVELAPNDIAANVKVW
jgi:hypothetical protein